MDRYRNEVNRLYGVMDRRLADRPFLAGEYSIADMASYPWAVLHERQGQKIADFPHLKKWLETIAARPATVRAYANCGEGQSGAGRHPHRGGACHPVRPDRGVDRQGGGRGALAIAHVRDTTKRAARESGPFFFCVASERQVPRPHSPQ